MVDHRLRLEHAPVVGERGERPRIDGDAEVGLQRPDELGVDLEGAEQLQLEVGVVSPDGERSQQHGRGAGEAAQAPGGEADGEVDGVDAPGGAQLDVLGGDALGGKARVSQGHFVAEEPRQQCRAPGDELRQAPRVGTGDLDALFAGVAVVQQRRSSAQLRRLAPQLFPRGVGDMRNRDTRFGKTEVAGVHGRTGHGISPVHHDIGLDSPHVSHTKRPPPPVPLGGAGFRGIGDTPSDRPFLHRRPRRPIAHR